MHVDNHGVPAKCPALVFVRMSILHDERSSCYWSAREEETVSCRLLVLCRISEHERW